MTGGTSETLHFRTWPIGLAWPMTLPVSCVVTQRQLSHGNINCSVNKLVTTAVANLTLKMKTITFYDYCYLSSQYQYLLFIHLFLTSIINFVQSTLTSLLFQRLFVISLCLPQAIHASSPAVARLLWTVARTQLVWLQPVSRRSKVHIMGHTCA